MNKSTPTTPVNGYLSLQCSAGRHHACRPLDWACTGCPCHQLTASASTVPASEHGEVVGLVGTVDGDAGITGLPKATDTSATRTGPPLLDLTVDNSASPPT